MGDSVKTENTPKTAKKDLSGAVNKPVKFWAGVKSEFKKITWPDKDSLMKQSVAVVIISVVIGAIITILDFGLQYGVDFITTFKF